MRLNSILQFTAVVAVMLCSENTLACGWSYELNTDYFSNLKVTEEMKILRISEGGTLQVYGKPGGKIARQCNLSVESWKSCEITAAGIGYCYDTFDVLIKQIKDGWFEVLADPKNGKTVWISEKAPQRSNFEVVPLGNWIADKWKDAIPAIGGFLFANSAKSMPIFSKTDDKSSIIEECGPSPYSTGYASNAGLVAVGDVRGKWLEASCQTNKCLTTIDHVLPCRSWDKEAGDDELAKDEDFYKKLKPCKQGWVRWLDNNGKVLLYPSRYGINCD